MILTPAISIPPVQQNSPSLSVDVIPSSNAADVVTNLKINKADKESINIYPKKDITILGKKSDASLKYDIEFEKGKIELPLKKGDIVGNIIIKNGNNVVGKVDAVVNENIKTIGFFKLLLNNFKDIVSGNLI